MIVGWIGWAYEGLDGCMIDWMAVWRIGWL